MSIRSFLTSRRWSLRRAGVAFPIFITVAAGIVALFGAVPDLRVGFCLLALICALSLCAGLAARQTHISPGIIEEPRALVAKVCSAAELREANELAHYGRDSIPNTLAEAWREASPNSFVCLIDQHPHVVASFGILGLSASFLDQFLHGRLIESQLTAADLLPWSQTLSQEALYISGVVVRDAGSPRGWRWASIMMWSMLVYVRTFFDLTKPRRVYALAATPEGERILRKLNFEIYTPAEARLDHHNLYYLSVTPEAISRIDARLPDYSHLCSIDFSTVHEPAAGHT